jgi:hypothetical protein
MLRLCAVVSALVVCCVIPARATTYLSVTFDDLITRADVIFVGEVVDVRPFALDTRDGTIIKTRVTFSVSDPLFGTNSLVEVFDFLGGELNGVGMAVAEMPTFAVGDRRVMFASRERSINPIVGFTQGLLRVTRDASGVDRIQTLDGAPLASPESIGPRAPGVTLAPVTPMRLSEFRDRITRALTAARRQ